MSIKGAVFLAFTLDLLSSQSLNAQELPPNMKAALVGEVAAFFGPDSYPAEALRAKRQGRVVADIGVDSTGAPVSCIIKISSGTTSLDTGTCDIALANLHFNPATDREGRTTASVYPLAVRWQLPSGSDGGGPVLDLSSGSKDGEREMEFTYSADGTLVACKLLSDTFPVKDPRPCGNYKIGDKAGARWSTGDQRVGAKVVERYTAHVTPIP